VSTNLSALRTKTRRYLDESSADRWSNTDVDAHINDGIRWLQSEIELANPDHFLRVETITAAQGSWQLALPSDILGNRLRSLQCYESSTVATGAGSRVEPGALEWVYQNHDTSGTPLNYAMYAGYLIWAPLLQYNSCFRFIYAKKEATLTNDTDNMDRIPDEHADIVTTYASILALESKGLDSAGFRTILERRVMQMKYDVTPQDPITLPQTEID